MGETLPPPADQLRSPLLFVHGAWHGAWCWERLVPWFEGRGWECHTLDFRGHGNAPSDRSLRRTRIADYIADLATVVARIDRPPVVVAHSMGSLVAQRFLETTTLPGAVLLSPVPLGGVWRTTLRVARRHPLAFAKANLVLDLRPLVARRSIAADLLLADETDPDEIDRVFARLQGESYRAYLDMLLFVRARPPLVATPVRIVGGSADRVFSTTEVRRLAGAYGTEATVIAGGAHDLMLGPHWEETARAIDAAIASL